MNPCDYGMCDQDSCTDIFCTESDVSIIGDYKKEIIGDEYESNDFESSEYSGK